MLDVAVLVPFQPEFASWIDPAVRRVVASKLPALRAWHRFEEFLGRTVSAESTLRWGTATAGLPHRSATAVALATSLESAGLGWRVLDPGAEPLSWWRTALAALARERPRLVAITTTFIVDGLWLGTLCALARRMLPDARIALGGYYYATDAKQFLSYDADIFCVGEGEKRIVEITEAVRDGRPLNGIGGLYLREPGGRLRTTGPVEPLDLDRVPLPDWSLSARIEPPIDVSREAIRYSVETQRGCVFKCEFCTFRTLAAPAETSIRRAVQVIRGAATHGNGFVFIVDGTGTYPRDRWRRILEGLIEEGSSPLPISVFARVSDLDDRVCALMDRAGVRHVYIGQETGDQALLNAMRKGTRVDQVRPAIQALGRHHITATFAFIYGFPGETEASMAATRRMLLTLNDDFASAPVVLYARIGVFAAQDFAAIVQRDVMSGSEAHRFGYEHLAVTPARAAEEAMATYIEMSRIDHAPITGFDLNMPLWDAYWQMAGTSDEAEFFRWAKAFDRGIGIFAREELEGTRPDLVELRRARETVLSCYEPGLRRHSRWRRLWTHAKHRLFWRVASEWECEASAGVGPLTRSFLGYEALRSTGDPGAAWCALQSAAYPPLGIHDGAPGADPETLAGSLVELGRAIGRRKRVARG